MAVGALTRDCVMCGTTFTADGYGNFRDNADLLRSAIRYLERRS